MGDGRIEIPDGTYFGGLICVKLLMPSVITYIACNTYTISLLSWWYPLIWTIILLYQVRLEEEKKKYNITINATITNITTTENSAETTTTAITNGNPNTTDKNGEEKKLCDSTEATNSATATRAITTTTETEKETVKAISLTTSKTTTATTSSLTRKKVPPSSSSSARTPVTTRSKAKQKKVEIAESASGEPPASKSTAMKTTTTKTVTKKKPTTTSGAAAKVSTKSATTTAKTKTVATKKVTKTTTTKKVAKPLTSATARGAVTTKKSLTTKTAAGATKVGTKTTATIKKKKATTIGTRLKKSSATSTGSTTKTQPKMTRAARLRMEQMEKTKGKGTTRTTTTPNSKLMTPKKKTPLSSNDKRRSLRTRSSLRRRSSIRERMLVTVKKKYYSSFTFNEQITYWLHYWNLYSTIQLLKILIPKMPIISRVLLMQPAATGGFFTVPAMLAILEQVELFFYIWIIFINHDVLLPPPNSLCKSLFKNATNEEDLHIPKDLNSLFEYLFSNNKKKDDEDLSRSLSLFQQQQRNMYLYNANTILKLLYLPIYESVSKSLFSKEFWDEKIMKNVTRLLDALVFMRLLPYQYSISILHYIEQIHPVIIPSISLSMPGYFTVFGVYYVQYVIPNARSITASNENNDIADSKEKEDKDNDEATTKKGEPETSPFQQYHYLQYWVLHMIMASQIDYWKVWWIPFYTHFTYILWCALSFTHISNMIYDEVEHELIAFGLFPKKNISPATHTTGVITPATGVSITDTITSVGSDNEYTFDFEQTKTSKLIRAIVKYLPSAAVEDSDDDDYEEDDQFDDDDDDDDVNDNNVDGEIDNNNFQYDDLLFGSRDTTGKDDNEYDFATCDTDTMTTMTMTTSATGSIAGTDYDEEDNDDLRFDYVLENNEIDDIPSNSDGDSQNEKSDEKNVEDDEFVDDKNRIMKAEEESDKTMVIPESVKEIETDTVNNKKKVQDDDCLKEEEGQFVNSIKNNASVTDSNNLSNLESNNTVNGKEETVEELQLGPLAQ